eukprot:767688-Hanusia_phi.AAC.11
MVTARSRGLEDRRDQSRDLHESSFRAAVPLHGREMTRARSGGQEVNKVRSWRDQDDKSMSAKVEERVMAKVCR